MTRASFEKMPPAVLSREYVTYLEKKKLSELVWSRELFCSIILLSCQEEVIFINEGWKGVNLG